MLFNSKGLFVIFTTLVLFGCSGGNPEQSSDFNIQDVPNYNPDPTGNTQGNADDANTGNPNETKTRWDVPGGGAEIIAGCLGRDCIPALQNPELISLDQATFLKEDDLLEGLIVGDEVRGYPLRILDWHEIINQNFSTNDIAVTYCPLTGSAVALETEANLVSCGVSGLLYNNNLIPYDRGTGSNWVQMLLRSVNGVLRGEEMITVPLIETSWRTWKKMFPNSRVVSTNTGFNRPYNIFPFGTYKTDPFLLFPIMIDDKRLPRKERLHGIIADRFNFKAKTYQFSLFENARAINDQVEGEPVVVAGMKSAAFYISYSRIAQDGTVLRFDIKTESPHIFPFDLTDNEGDVWNLLGEAVSGPRKGEKLTPTVSYNAYWFAWGTLFPDVPIFHE
ncbi:MAG: DUF3179 domain-containing protein [bacterium]